MGATARMFVTALDGSRLEHCRSGILGRALDLKSPLRRWPPSSRAGTPPSWGSKADASALTAYALQSTVDTSSQVDAALLGKADASALASLLSTVDGLDTPLEVDTKIAHALPSSQRSLLAGTPASRRSRGPRPTRRCWPHTPRTPRSPPRSRAPSTQSSRSLPPCSFGLHNLGAPSRKQQPTATTRARVFLERDGGAHQCELIMINNDEALVQTKSLSTQLSLTTNQRNPGCLVIAGNTGNVVCNTSFTNLSDSRVKTEMAEADVAELKQLFDSVEAKQYKRPRT